MLVSSNNSLSFGSNYKFNINRDNIDRSGEVLSDMYMMERHGANLSERFNSFDESTKTGIFMYVTVSADDKQDHKIETILKNNGIDFHKMSIDDGLKPESIKSRIKLSDFDKQKGNSLVELDVKNFDELFQKEDTFYINAHAGNENAIGNRYEQFQEYLKTGQDIDASGVHFSEKDNELFVTFVDGRHRYAVMRDMGIEKIPFSLNNSSLELVKKYGLI